MTIGICTVSSQSGRAYFADLIQSGYNVCGYARESEHGKEFVNAVRDLDGIFLDRPPNTNGEIKKFINLGENFLTHDLKTLVEVSDFIVLAEPSIYFLETVTLMKKFGLLEKFPPLILSPSRTFSTPYIWNELGENYPIVSFSTCHYACKAPRPDTAYIERRKRNWTASLEGKFKLSQIAELGQIFPQAIFNRRPMTTSIGNIGAIFHPATYLLNYEEIQRRKISGKNFSFYIEGIAERPEVGKILESIDFLRLYIAEKSGFKTFGLPENDNAEEWQDIMNEIAFRESKKNDLLYWRKVRRDGLEKLKYAVPACRNWLDYTYAVRYRVGESLSEAVGRTPTYQKNFFPQKRYLDEDIATGLIPLLAFAERIGLSNTEGANRIKELLDLCKKIYPARPTKYDRTLEEFENDYLIKYLDGEFFSVTD